MNPPAVDNCTAGVRFKRDVADFGEPSNFNKETDFLCAGRKDSRPAGLFNSHLQLQMRAVRANQNMYGAHG